MLTLIFVFISLIYLVLIGLLIYGFDKVEDFRLQDLPSKTSFTIVIPFRNEAENLPKLLSSIAQLNYPNTLFEVILVDDNSEDESVSIIETFIEKNASKYHFNNRQTIQIIKNENITNAPKKAAISSAITLSRCNWIITTDADCILPKYWLDAFDECIQTTQPNCIVAPVTYHDTFSFLNRFQTLDFLSLQGATLGGFGIKKPFMCNGANFAYLKSNFNDVNGFEGNQNIASGDDVFLLEKFIKQDAKKVKYLKSKQAIVTTNPAKNVKHLIQQRVRWASKTKRYKQGFPKVVGLVVLFGNLVCLGLIPAVYFNFMTLKIAIILFIIKFSIDFLLLFKTTRFYNQENLLVSYVFSSVIYPFFNVRIAFLTFFKSYEWKGRTFKT